LGFSDSVERATSRLSEILIEKLDA